jgi:hypothetical protein
LELKNQNGTPKFAKKQSNQERLLMLKESTKTLCELNQWLGNSNQKYFKMNQSLLTFLDFYKEIERIANQAVPKECHK